MFKLDFWNNTKQELSGIEEINARLIILNVNILKRVNDQVGRLNRIRMRVERGIALAR